MSQVFQEPEALLDPTDHALQSASRRQTGLSAEMELLFLCTRWPRRPEDEELVRHAVAGPLDWKLFATLVQHHRVVPLVTRALQGTGVEGGSTDSSAVMEELKRAAVAASHRALWCLAELRRVVEALQADAMPVLVLKGLPLAKSVFGDPGLRMQGDLDFLIPESALAMADSRLRELGYEGIVDLQQLSNRQTAFYRAHWKDVAYENHAKNIDLDLHWRCFRNRQMPGTGLCSFEKVEIVSFGPFQVKTLSTSQNLLYLCVHGALDGWLYLKSLVDVAAQVRQMKSAELEVLAELATSQGVLPEFTAALLLVRRYWGMDHWSGHLLQPSDPAVRPILEYTDRNLHQNGFLTDREAIPISRTFAFEWRLRKGYQYRRELLLRILFRPRMWRSIRLPDWLFWLYPVLSPVEWATYRMRALWRRQEGHPASVRFEEKIP